MKARWNVSPHVYGIVLDYVKGEPSFTPAFMAWDLRQRGTVLSRAICAQAIRQLADEKTIELIEDGGRMGKVYAYTEPKPARYVSGGLPELDAHRHAVVADLAPVRGEPVAGTGRPHLQAPVGKGLKARRNIAKNRRRAA